MSNETEWVLVPREPSEAMLSAAHYELADKPFSNNAERSARAYAAMLDAAPHPPAEAQADRMAIKMLVAAGLVTESKANEALNIAHGFDKGPLAPAEAQPVAWMVQWIDESGDPIRAVEWDEEDVSSRISALPDKAAATVNVTPLYAHPPPSAPVGEVRAAIQRDIDDHGVAEIRQAELDALTAPSAPVGVEGLPLRYFAYDGDNGDYNEYNTLAEAVASAQESLDYAGDDGWPVGGPSICYGAVLGEAREVEGSRRPRGPDDHPDFDFIVEYELTEAALAQQPAAVDGARVSAKEIAALRTVFPDAKTHDLVDGILAVKNETALAAQQGGRSDD